MAGTLLAYNHSEAHSRPPQRLLRHTTKGSSEMTRILKFTILLTTVLSLGGVAEQASAQCDPDATFCADAQGRNGRRATVQVRTRSRAVVVQPAPPPPVVVVQQPAPPPPERI